MFTVAYTPLAREAMTAKKENNENGVKLPF
jgi:hypothetical protein